MGPTTQGNRIAPQTPHGWIRAVVSGWVDRFVRLHVLAAVVLSVASWSGCCCMDRMYCPSNCEMGLGPASSCGGACGGTCNECSLGHVAHRNMTCGAGCGEVYWGEWLSDPPRRCDPCDGCGNWDGARCCPPPIFECLCQSLQSLFCMRCLPTSCCEVGSSCSTCGGEGHGEMMMEGAQVYEHVAPMQGTPRPAVPKQTLPPQAKPSAQLKPMPPHAAPHAATLSPYRKHSVRPASNATVHRHRAT